MLVGFLLCNLNLQDFFRDFLSFVLFLQMNRCVFSFFPDLCALLGWRDGCFFCHFGMVDLGSTGIDSHVAKSRTRQPEVKSLSTPKNGGILGSGNPPQVQL